MFSCNHDDSSVPNSPCTDKMEFLVPFSILIMHTAMMNIRNQQEDILEKDTNNGRIRKEEEVILEKIINYTNFPAILENVADYVK